MLGLTQNQPINLVSILEHAARWHSDQEIVTRCVEDGEIRRQTYKQTRDRTMRLANALIRLGVAPGDRVATMAWNTFRHIEVWYATAGTASVCHTLNPRLFPDQINFIVNHAEDRLLFVDVDLVPVIEPMLAQLPTLEAVIVLTDKAHMPDCAEKPGRWLCYEDLIAEEQPDFAWRALETDADASSLCYTSGTTGDPKGVLYSHRSNFFHAFASLQKDAMNIGSMDTVLMIVPMFHANSWGLTFSVPMVGAKMILPGRHLDGASVYQILEQEAVSFSAAVPTVWSMLLTHLSETNARFSTLREVVIGGTAVPRSMIETFKKSYNVDVIHAWGMTEMSPLGTLNRPVGGQHNDTTDWPTQLDQLCTQGRVSFGVDIKIVDEDDNAVPHDGKSVGRLLARGPATVERYFKQDTTALNDGWFDSGDMASIDEAGFMTITDRSKDVIKSGGEWISSVEIENAAVAHKDVALAACIGIPDDKWDERPLLLVQLAVGAELDKAGILAKLSEHIAKWQLPDHIIAIDKIPLTATGKVDKKPLKKEFRNAPIEQD